MKSARTLYVLCGGKSRRMGSDKALVKLDGETLLDRQLSKSGLYFRETVVLSGSNHYPVTNRQLPDPVEDAGPLAGLLAALRDGKIRKDQWIAILPVDLPFMSDSSIEYLSKTIPSPHCEALLIKTGENIQPLAGVYNTKLSNRLQHTLESGNRMVFGFINMLKYDLYEVPEGELKNVNRPEDLSN